MKYVFGIDITKNKENKVIDGHVFLSNSAYPDIRAEIQKQNDIFTILTKQKSLPAWMEVIKWLSFSSACFILIVMINMIESLGVIGAYYKAPYFFYSFPVISLLSLVFYLFELKLKHSNTYFKQNLLYTEGMIKEGNNRINIPDHAIILVVLLFYYKAGNGRMKIVSRGKKLYKYQQMFAYIKNDNLYLSDLMDEWMIPLYCIHNLKKHNKKFSSLGITWFGKDFELLVPSFEQDNITTLLGPVVNVL